MLTRYTIIRGARRDALPKGIRQDTRKHTRHFLRPTPEIVSAVFASDGSEAAWAEYAMQYRALLQARALETPKKFDLLATMSRWHDVLLGCSCPSSKNPDVRRCHTVLALRFMLERYPTLDVRFPPEAQR